MKVAAPAFALAIALAGATVLAAPAPNIGGSRRGTLKAGAWKTYWNRKWGFGFHYPSAWSPAPKDSSEYLAACAVI